MKVEFLEIRWHKLMRKYKAPNQFIAPLWREILLGYSEKMRYYHTLYHIADLLTQADKFRDQIQDFDTLELAIWYHDIIYQCLRKDNEEKSAVYAKYRLEAIRFPRKRLVRCYHQIIATKSHQLTAEADQDTAWLLDFDLSILGKNWPTYLKYTQQIRQEYAVFPTFLYNRGRINVLNSFLERDRLFQTDVYFERYEQQARENIQRELVILKK